MWLTQSGSAGRPGRSRPSARTDGCCTAGAARARCSRSPYGSRRRRSAGPAGPRPASLGAASRACRATGRAARGWPRGRGAARCRSSIPARGGERLAAAWPRSSSAQGRARRRRARRRLGPGSGHGGTGPGDGLVRGTAGTGARLARQCQGAAAATIVVRMGPLVVGVLLRRSRVRPAAEIGCSISAVVEMAGVRGEVDDLADVVELVELARPVVAHHQHVGAVLEDVVALELEALLDEDLVDDPQGGHDLEPLAPR